MCDHDALQTHKVLNTPELSHDLSSQPVKSLGSVAPVQSCLVLQVSTELLGEVSAYTTFTGQYSSSGAKHHTRARCGQCLAVRQGGLRGLLHLCESHCDADRTQEDLKP